MKKYFLLILKIALRFKVIYMAACGSKILHSLWYFKNKLHGCWTEFIFFTMLLSYLCTYSTAREENCLDSSFFYMETDFHFKTQLWDSTLLLLLIIFSFVTDSCTLLHWKNLKRQTFSLACLKKNCISLTSSNGEKTILNSFDASS